MPKYKFKVVLPPQVIYEEEAATVEEAQCAADQRWFADGWHRTHPECPLQLTTEEAPVLHHSKELLRSLGSLVQKSAYVGAEERFAAKQSKTLLELQENTQKYQEVLAEMQTALRRHQLELEEEVKLVAAHQSK